MNLIVSALAQGFLAVLLHWRLVLTMWVLTAATAWLVAAPYGPEGRPLGTIGVIGPARMNYSRVIPLVDFTADMIGETLTKP